MTVTKEITAIWDVTACSEVKNSPVLARSAQSIHDVYKRNAWQFIRIFCNSTYFSYKTIIRPVVLYGSEAWCLTAKNEKNLHIWEMKVLRKIFGPIMCSRILEEQNKRRNEAIIWRIGHSIRNKKKED